MEKVSEGEEWELSCGGPHICGEGEGMRGGECGW